MKEEAAYYTALKLKEADDLRHGIIDGAGLPKIDAARSGAVASVPHEAAFTALRSIAFKVRITVRRRTFSETK